MKSFAPLCRTSGFVAGTWRCTCDHVAPGAEQHSDHATLNVPLSGLFARHVGRRTTLVDTTVATLTNPGETWRSSHPSGRGDTGIWVMLSAEQAGALADSDRERPFRDGVRPLSPETWLAWRRWADDPDVELGQALVADLIAESPLEGDPETPAVRRAKAILSDTRTPPPSLERLAESVGASPWHLCRTFRRATGWTPRAFAEQIRLRRAADAVAAGCDDLASLALELHFTSHSHLTDRFRRTFGRTPTAMRASRR